MDADFCCEVAEVQVSRAGELVGREGVHFTFWRQFGEPVFQFDLHGFRAVEHELCGVAAGTRVFGFGGLAVEGAADFGHDGGQSDHLHEDGAAFCCFGVDDFFLGDGKGWDAFVEVFWSRSCDGPVGAVDV